MTLSCHLTWPAPRQQLPPDSQYGNHIKSTHITKVKFFTAFTAAYKESMIAENCQAGFLRAGLVPFDPQVVISKLGVKSRTPTPSRPSTASTIPWFSQTPSNPSEALSQTTLVRKPIARHQESSPTPVFKTVAALAKGTERVAHATTLLSAEVRILRAANEALSKRRRLKRLAFIKRARLL